MTANSRKMTNLNELKDLLGQFLHEKMPAEDFCNSFEKIWNFEFDKSSLSDKQFESLDFLFDEATLFCPLPRDQWGYPKYRDAAEIRTAAENSLRAIEIGSL